MKNKIAAIYIRVSTDAQAEEGYSIDAQKQQLTAYCVSKNIKNYDYYIDGGWSGSNIDRPELQRLIKDIQSNKISHCIVYKLDRLSRSQKDTLYLIEDIFNPYGVNFVSLNESMDTSTPMGRLMLGILSAFAQLERENIRMRTRMGMQERVKNGLWMGGGRVPFGYDYDKEKGILIQNSDSEKVKEIYDLYLKGYSAQNIANIIGLKYERLATQILKRKINYGVIEYNGQEYKGKHEPIISKETYDLAMQEMSRRSEKYVGTSEHLLTGLVYCGKCGAKMRYQKWGKSRCKFVCYSQQSSKKYLIKDPCCNQEKIWADEIEEAIKNTIFALKEKRIDKPDNNELNSSVLNILMKQKDELNTRLKRFYTLYADNEDSTLIELISECKNKIKQIENKIDKEKKQNIYILTKINKDNKINLDTLQSRWDFMDIKEQQHIIRLLVDKITITDTNVEIKLTF